MKTYDHEVTTYNQTEFWQKMKSFAPEAQHEIMLKSRHKMKPTVFKVQHLKEANELAMDETLPPRWKTESLFSRFESSVFLTCSEMDIALGPQCE